MKILNPGVLRIPRNIIWGRGSTAFLKSISGERAAIITGKSMVSHGVVPRVARYLKEAGLTVKVLDAIKPEPSMESIRELLSENKTFRPDVIVGIGGGSSIDASKAFRIFFEYPDLVLEDICSMDGQPKADIPPFRKTQHIALPSTSGSGSEVSAGCILSDAAHQMKYPILNHRLVPDVAIVDPDIADSQPAVTLADAAMDALANGIESYVSIKANEFSRSFSLRSIVMIMKYLPLAFLDDDPIARARLHYAATIAGVAFTNSSVGICHTIADKVGPAFNISHGRAVAVALPYAIKFNGRMVGDLYATISWAMEYDRGGAGDSVAYLVSWVRELREMLGIPDNFHGCGIPQRSYVARIDEFIAKSVGFPATITNPRKPSLDDLKSLYLASYEGNYDRL